MSEVQRLKKEVVRLSNGLLQLLDAVEEGQAGTVRLGELRQGMFYRLTKKGAVYILTDTPGVGVTTRGTVVNNNTKRLVFPATFDDFARDRSFSRA